MVGLDGEKMSKSKGNLVLVSRLREDGARPDGDPAGPPGPPLPQRLAVGRGRRLAAGARLDKWRGALAKGAGAPTDQLVTDVLAALAEDLDAPTALARWSTTGPTRTDFGDDSEPGAGEVVRGLVDARLGVAL